MDRHSFKVKNLGPAGGIVRNILGLDGDLQENVNEHARKALLDAELGDYVDIAIAYEGLLKQPTPSLFSDMLEAWDDVDWAALQHLFVRWPRLKTELDKKIERSAPHNERGLRRVMLDTMDAGLLEWLHRRRYMAFREDDRQYMLPKELFGRTPASTAKILARGGTVSVRHERRFGARPVLDMLRKYLPTVEPEADEYMVHPLFPRRGGKADARDEAQM